ncbi:DEAD/DEAH box helicase [Bacillus massiliglaciei]|uniref:DEAD/DEAH box helicase n=1 Tax=Bacillus massiliglaciei TaxID=1816693 RepID=UPI001F42A42C|nr:DEAD/DEAH box helicase family protein [Bacillus massiliglaciei]
MFILVNFKKRLGTKKVEKKIHPSEIYNTLDRASDKGPLRPVQASVLDDWFENYRKEQDLILKLHTGQGKTLIGLLMLQSRLNEDTGPAIYLCPNKFLVEQTCQQAESFGIHYAIAEDDLPDEFIDGKAILITSVHKLFNGKSRFGVGQRGEHVSTILMDDAHACMNEIKDAFNIKLKSDSNAYQEILNLFGFELEKQGYGTYADIKRKNYDSILPVPYWDWQDKQTEVAQILSKYSVSSDIKYAWPLLKDMLRDCQCIISGTSLEISPYRTPLEMFKSYYRAERRIFMSATITDDSFMIKGLGLNIKTIENPLMDPNEHWSGEKMILIPSLIDQTLNRGEIVNRYAKPVNNKKYGTVVLVPSFKNSKDWGKYGSTVATKESIETEIQKLKDRQCDKTLVIANRYDGIDLPDYSCRILIIDSKPYFESLLDRYLESCRGNSEILDIKLAQIIEQGLGRGVRGEKDYNAIVLTGSELIKFVRSKKTRKFFSNQTRTQIEIGLKIAEYAKEDIKDGKEPLQALEELIDQSLKRDEGWKEFYVEQMDEMTGEVKNKQILGIFEYERQAEKKYLEEDYQGAINIIQKLLDEHIKTDEERGWYFQEMARYIYPLSKTESNKYQILAHKKNPYLLRPKEGMQIQSISAISLKRIENIMDWIRQFESNEELQLSLDDMLAKLTFGVKADRFEQELDNLAKALGFISQRPDKEWKEGPDNLWKVKDDQYLLIECKSNVDTSRVEIHKDETGQMNNACAWFQRNYEGITKVKRVMIIPTKKVNRAAGFNFEVEVMRERGLNSLKKNVKNFFNEFKSSDIKDLSERKIQEFLNLHNLSVDDIVTKYTEKVKTY